MFLNKCKLILGISFEGSDSTNILNNSFFVTTVFCYDDTFLFTLNLTLFISIITLLMYMYQLKISKHIALTINNSFSTFLQTIVFLYITPWYSMIVCDKKHYCTIPRNVCPHLCIIQLLQCFMLNVCYVLFTCTLVCWVCFCTAILSWCP